MTDVSDHTGFPEMMDGRVKTLHPKVHGGLLALRDDAGHAASMADHDIAPIDCLVVNLYPFEATMIAKGAGRDEIIENIDIGGPAMVRSSAKNHAPRRLRHQPVRLCRADRRARRGPRHDRASRSAKRLAARAFAATATYDSDDCQPGSASRTSSQQFPDTLPLVLHTPIMLRYGENPHQQAAFYNHAGPAGRASVRRGRSRARSSATIISTMPTARSS